MVLLSGGLDSATTLAIAREAGYACYALNFDYGQRHKFEMQAAGKVAQQLGALELRTLSVDLGALGGSALTGDIPVPKGADIPAITSSEERIPVTYVPARNTIFLSFGLAYAEVLDATDIFIGVNAIDYSGYPDCRPAFIDAFQKMANLATKIGVEHAARNEPAIRIHAPLMHMSKAQIIRRGIELGVDYGLTHSCYDPHLDGRPCGQCDACLLRAAGFREAGIEDPALAG